MSDARPGTRMTVVDWSGRRMLAVRKPAGVGTGAWGLLKRLARIEGFGQGSRWAESRFLASQIAESLAGSSGNGESRPWDFLADAPEGEVLALQSPAAEEASPPVTRRARRPQLFAARARAPGRRIRPGGARREFAGVAAGALGFVRLRSEVPMGTAGTPSAGAARSGRPRTVAPVRPAGGTRFEVAREDGDLATRTPRLGAVSQSHDDLGGRRNEEPSSRVAHPLAPSTARFLDPDLFAGQRPRMTSRAFSHLSRFLDPDLFAGQRPRRIGSGRSEGRPWVTGGDPGTALSPFVETPLASRVLETAGLSGLALESPEVAWLVFPRRSTEDRESSPVYPERVTTRSMPSGTDTQSSRSGRGSRGAAAREAGPRPGTGTPSVARATFSPRRAGVEAPWFAPSARPNPVYGRTPGSVVMGPAWPRDTGSDASTPGPVSPTGATRSTSLMVWAPSTGFPQPVLITTLPGVHGGTEAAWSSLWTPGGNLSRLASVSGAEIGTSEPRVPRSVVWTGETGDAAVVALRGRPAGAGSPDEGGPPASFARIPGRWPGMTTAPRHDGTIPDTRSGLTSSRWPGMTTTTPRHDGTIPDTRSGLTSSQWPGMTTAPRGDRAVEKTWPPAAGRPRIYPERLVSRTVRAGGGDAADRAGPAASEPTATPSGIQTATFVPRRANIPVEPDFRSDIVSAGEVLAALGMKGVEAAGTAAHVLRVMQRPSGTVSKAVFSGAEGGGWAPWVSEGAGERAWLALSGPNRYGVGRDGTEAPSPRARAVGFAGSRWPSIAAPGPGKATPERASRGKGIYGAARQGLEPGSRRSGDRPGDRPEAMAGGGYGTTPLARWMAGHLGMVSTRSGRADDASVRRVTGEAVWGPDDLLRLGFPGAGLRPATSRPSAVARTGTMTSPGGGSPVRRPRKSASSPEMKFLAPGHDVGSGPEEPLAKPATRFSEGRETPFAAVGRYGETPFAAVRRYGETLVTQVMAARAAQAHRSAASMTAIPEADTPAVPGFTPDVEEVFLQLLSTEPLQDVASVVGAGPTVTRPGGEGRRRWSPDTVVRTTPPAGWPRTVVAPAGGGGVGLAGPRRRAGGARSLAGPHGRRKPMDGLTRMDSPEGTLLKAPPEAEWGSGPGRTTPWDVPGFIGSGESAPLVLFRTPETQQRGTPEAGDGRGAPAGRESRSRSGWRGTPEVVNRDVSGPIPAGAMWFIQRTLGRALRALPPESFGEAGPQGEATSGLIPPDLVRLLGVVPMGTRTPREGTAGSPWEGIGGVVRDLVVPPGPEAATSGKFARTVRPERLEARPPGLPEEPVTIELSLGDTGPAGPVVGPGTVPSISGLIRAGEAPSPALRGLPLVAPAVQAVASQAMLSRRTEGARPTQAPGGQAPATGAQAAGSQPIDLDVLAMEMAERILRRMKRDKERRGHHD